MANPKQEARRQIKEIAEENNTDENVTTFILGPYEPSKCKDFLIECRDRLKTYNVTAFLEEDVPFSYTQTELFYALADIADLSVFIIPKGFKSYGWQTEIGQLVPVHPHKVAIYYEDVDEFPITTKDLMASYQIFQSKIIDSDNLRRSIESVCNHVNTILLNLHL